MNEFTFQDRHIGPNQAQQELMLKELGMKSLDELLDKTIPGAIRFRDSLSLPEALSEDLAQKELKQLAAENITNTSLIGLGYYNCLTPAVIRRNILENPSWYTAYTPYQPEISQGRLEALILFQTMIEDLTGLPVANASLLDEPTAAAEAMRLAQRSSKNDSNIFLVDKDTHPQTIEVIRNRAIPIGIEVKLIDIKEEEIIDNAFGVLISYPTSSGLIRNLESFGQVCKEKGIVVIATTDLLALTLIKEPTSFGAEIAVGSAQRFGVPLGFGGPHAGFMAVSEELSRSLPGRLVGVSVDSTGRAAYRLALQTREQHIRRGKATSNICTAQVLLAVISATYAAYHGPKGLKAIAERVHNQALNVAKMAESSGHKVFHNKFFDTVLVQTKDSDQLIKKFLENGLNIRKISNTEVSISIDETTNNEVMEKIAKSLDTKLVNEDNKDSGISNRTSKFLTHVHFNRYHNETALLRWLRSMSDKDIALDRSMIPLGSCTMKLNAASEMEPITWPQLAGIHPFAPIEQSRGWQKIINQLQDWLCEITGYDAISLQPNAGSQGEFAGLLAIRAYQENRGQGHRNICLIPSSAHGTNAASAVMAGMQVEVVECTETGDVDLKDLENKIIANKDNLAAVMVTYPSTHGVFEEGITKLCEMVHDAGGQVYVDGANLNAMVAVANPGKFGADVSHLNLHKTFCIPHGGGGPGVGPVAVRSHLAPYLPTHPLNDLCGPKDKVVGPISGAPYGSAGILPISWMYIRMMGAKGLFDATSSAILSANYLAHKLSKAFPILYSGKNNTIAHECILDIREITKETGVTVDDIAKRLMDYGFHAPTMSFPVAGTLMIEPTESEDLIELDRFVEAMLNIKAEIDEIANGEFKVEDSALRHAPHTAEELAGEWNRQYSREKAVFPVSGLRGKKYWPPVNRIDGAYGDRNLICSCPSPREFANAQ
ncbi:MAG: aminomethyl-transferring glycine dehydrogenase [Candidatus Nanopelagicales bacterium]